MAASIEDIVRFLKAAEADNAVTPELGERLRKILLDKRFLTVYRSSLLISVVEASNLEKVSQEIALDQKLMEILEKEVRANEARGRE